MNLFLDDYRLPLDCSKYMYKDIGSDNVIYTDSTNWVVVRNYSEFISYLQNNTLPKLISFDHDLADAHYHESMYKDGKVYMKYLETTSEKTGYDCAKWLIEFCNETKQQLPQFIVHSMNPIGKGNIISLLTSKRE